MTSTLTDGISINGPTKYADMYNDVGTPVTKTVRQLYRAGLHSGWRAWRQLVVECLLPAQGESLHIYEVYNHIQLKANFQNAIDAADDGSPRRQTQAKSGLPVGSIACRSTLTNFGQWLHTARYPGHRSLRTRRRFWYSVDNNDFFHGNIQQDTAGASMQGFCPGI